MMGDAEFEGGGSVKWQINHSDGDFCNGRRDGGSGRDKNPKTANGLFVVTVTGRKPIIVPTKGTKVRVVWGDPTDTQTAQAAASYRKAQAKKKTAAKARAAK
jgi:hypothetical protein